MVAQTESTPTPIYAKIKEGLILASVIVVVAGGIAAGLLGGMKLVIAPLQTDIRAIHGRLDRMDGHIQELDRTMQNEFKAVRGEIQELDRSTQNEFKAVRGEIQELDRTMQNEFKAVRGEISALSERVNGDISALSERFHEDNSTLSERVIRLETLLEQAIRPPDVPQ